METQDIAVMKPAIPAMAQQMVIACHVKEIHDLWTALVFVQFLSILMQIVSNVRVAFTIVQIVMDHIIIIAHSA